jgi:hypothetical protein
LCSFNNSTGTFMKSFATKLGLLHVVFLLMPQCSSPKSWGQRRHLGPLPDSPWFGCSKSPTWNPSRTGNWALRTEFERPLHPWSGSVWNLPCSRRQC